MWAGRDLEVTLLRGGGMAGTLEGSLVAKAVGGVSSTIGGMLEVTKEVHVMHPPLEVWW